MRNWWNLRKNRFEKSVDKTRRKEEMDDDYFCLNMVGNVNVLEESKGNIKKIYDQTRWKG